MEKANVRATEKEAAELLLKFEESEKWFSEHYEELRESYANKMLAINIEDKKIVSASSEIEELFRDLNSKNVDVNSVYIATIPPKGIAFIL